MEQPVSTSSLFNLSIDPVTKAHLSETAKWARFLAIVGFVFLGLMLVFGIFLSSFMATMFGSYDTYGGSGFMSAFGVGMAIMYIIIAALWFFPLLFLLRFANRMRTALNGNDQQALNISLQNLKVFFRFIGIMTIIILALYALAIIISIVGMAALS
jgi:MFS family permease